MRASLLAIQRAGGVDSEDISPRMLNYIPSVGYNGKAKFVVVNDSFLAGYGKANWGRLLGVGADIKGILNGGEGPVVELPTQFELAYKWVALKDGVKVLMNGQVRSVHDQAAQDGKLELVNHSYYGLHHERVEFVNQKMEPIKIPLITDFDYLISIVQGVVALQRRDYKYVGESARLNAFLDLVFYANIDGYYFVLYCLYRLLNDSLIQDQTPAELEKNFEWICKQVSEEPVKFFYNSFDPRSLSKRRQIAKCFSKHRGESKPVLLYAIAMADAINYDFLRTRNQLGHVNTAARVLRYLEERDSLELSLDYTTRKGSYV